MSHINTLHNIWLWFVTLSEQKREFTNKNYKFPFMKYTQQNTSRLHDQVTKQMYTQEYI